jgi:DNA-binding CsgD family transcriptional regulator
MDRAPLIKHLSPRQFEAVRLVCEHGLSYDQTARTMGISTQTIKNHLTEVRTRVGAPATTVVCRYYGEWKERNRNDGPSVTAARANEV